MTLITQDRLDALVRNAQLVPDGLFAECGVYKGGSLKLLAETFPDRSIIGFDTFEGLPAEQWSKDEYHEPGEFGDVSIEAVQDYVNCQNVSLVKGLFPESAKGYAKSKFAFVHIDFDFYEGIKACIEWFMPRLVKGGIMMFDDYGWDNCPGVKKAISEAGLKVIMTADYQCAVIK
jgi:O-methyltransferase